MLFVAVFAFDGIYPFEVLVGQHVVAVNPVVVLLQVFAFAVDAARDGEAWFF